MHAPNRSLAPDLNRGYNPLEKNSSNQSRNFCGETQIQKLSIQNLPWRNHGMIVSGKPWSSKWPYCCHQKHTGGGGGGRGGGTQVGFGCVCAIQASKCQPPFRKGLQSKWYPIKKKIGHFLIPHSKVKIVDVLKLSCVCNSTTCSRKWLE